MPLGHMACDVDLMTNINQQFLYIAQVFAKETTAEEQAIKVRWEKRMRGKILLCGVGSANLEAY